MHNGCSFARVSGRFVFAAVLWGVLTGVALAQPSGFGAMGASETHVNTVNPLNGSWVPHLVGNRALGFGPGDAWNVAIGGATSATLLTQGQHTTTASNVLAGDVDYVFLSIGGNDFLNQGTNIASGILSGSSLTSFITTYIDNVTTAVNVVEQASPAGFVLFGVPDISLLPLGLAQFTTTVQKQRIQAATDEANARLLELAGDRDLVFVDFAATQRALASLPSVVVGGLPIDMTTPGPQPSAGDHFYVDGVHPGALGNAVLASLFATALSDGYGLGIAPLSDLEILQNAGLSAQYTGETFTPTFDYSRFVITPVPEPSVASLAGCTLVAGFLLRIRLRAKASWGAPP